MNAYARALERGHSLRLAGRFEDALVAYGKAGSLANDATTAADALLGAAMVHRGLAHYEESLAGAESALRLYRRTGDREGEAFALYVRGGARRFLGRFRPASADLERALEIAGDAEARRFTLMALGGLRRMQGRYAESLDLYARARRNAQAADDLYAAAYAACGMGNAWRMLGARRRARRWLESALRGYASIRDRVSSPYTRFALALLTIEESSPASGSVTKRARQLITKARRDFGATRDPRGLVYADIADAVIEHVAGNGKGARSLARRALSASSRLGLALEAAHATWILEGPGAARPLYRRLGAPVPQCITAFP